MITVEEALRIVEKNAVSRHEIETVFLKEALNLVLAKDVNSIINMPPFPQSAMDGYALNFSDSSADILLIGEVAAGEEQNFILKENQAVRIFTGAEVPTSANMVVRQEDVVQTANKIIVKIFPNVGTNIRPAGEQIQKGQIALPKGHELNEASIGFLASLGIEKVSVYRAPTIVIISTGNELVPAGQLLSPGQIYDSNSLMLQAALQAKGFHKVTSIKVKDDFQSTVKTISNCLSKYDLIICSGGISVGDYDFIGKALDKNNVESHFYKVKQKPGKPLYFGQKNDTFVFGLPGNPAACLTCFYIYIFPFLSKWKGGGFHGLSKYNGTLESDYTRKGDRAQFLKARVTDANELEILDGQSSAMLKSFALANTIVYLPIDKSEYKAGDVVNYYRI